MIVKNATAATLSKINEIEKKLYFTEKQYRYARDECNALEYAQSRCYDLIRKGNYYQMKEHDSMVFTMDGRWFWNSRSLKGRAIEFIMAYEDKTLQEAVQILNHVEGQTYADVQSGMCPLHSVALPAPAHPKPIEKAPFKLPTQSNDFRRMFGYLCGTWKLDRDILRGLIYQGSLYESVYRYVAATKAAHQSSAKEQRKEANSALYRIARGYR